MKFLLFNQFFFPDSAATSQLLTDVAGALVDDGHSVRVICGRGGYAGENCGELPGVSIVRTWELPFRHGAVARMLSYLSYLGGAIWYGLQGPRADVVVTLTTPPMLSLVGWLVRAVRGGRHYIWEMDVYPDIAVDLGVLRAGAWSTRGLGWAQDAVQRRADGVIVLGESMRERLMRHGIAAERLHVAENWADGGEIQPQAFPSALPGGAAGGRWEAYGTLQVLYSGNLGLAHDLDTMSGGLEALAGDARFHFTFAGGGPQRLALERFCSGHGYENVEFRGYSARNELALTLAGCHLGLVTQKAVTLGAVVPSKVYGLMAAGRPVLYVGPAAGTPALMIRKFGCGWQVEPGDVAGLVAVLQRLAENSWEVEQAGARAYAAFQAHYDRPAGVARILKIVAQTPRQGRADPLVRSRPPGRDSKTPPPVALQESAR